MTSYTCKDKIRSWRSLFIILTPYVVPRRNASTTSHASSHVFTTIYGMVIHLENGDCALGFLIVLKSPQPRVTWYHLSNDGAHQSKGRHIGASCPSFTVTVLGLRQWSIKCKLECIWLRRRLPLRAVTAADVWICCCMYGPWHISHS